MTIKAVCPACQASFNVRDELQGKKIRCSKCREVFVVAGAAGKPVQASKPTVPKAAPRPVGDAAMSGPPKTSKEPAGPAAADIVLEEIPAQPPKRPGGRGLVLGIVGGAVLLVLLLCGGAAFAVYHFVFAAGQAVQEELKQQQGPKATPDFSLTAEDLQAEYEADKQAAVNKYKDKTIELSGVVKAVYGTSDPMVGLVAGKRTLGLTCVMADKGSKPQVAERQTVKIKGLWAAYGELPALYNRVVVETGPKPAGR